MPCAPSDYWFLGFSHKSQSSPHFYILYLILELQIGSSKAAEPEPLAPKNNATYSKCRYCKGEHWTSSCPHKHLFQDTEASEVPVADTKAPEPGKTAYVPPRLRPGADTGAELV
ncbi:hypothetical protein ACLB2K_024029 [Fragaria x ananassa]